MISGSRIAPMLTAILVYFSIPLSTLFNMLFFSDQNNNNMSRISLFGSTLIFFSSMLALHQWFLFLFGWHHSRQKMARPIVPHVIQFSLVWVVAQQLFHKFIKNKHWWHLQNQTLLNMPLSLFSFVFTF